MCGLLAIISKTGNLPSDGSHTLAKQTHRGPDSSGAASSEWYYIGMNRLAIVDEPGGSQPIYTPDDDVGIVINGEIYNFKKLKKEYERRGYQFRTQSDAEVVLAGYSLDGKESLRRLEGMYSLIIFCRKRIIVHRDPLGIKPLYIYEDRSQIIIGSEIKDVVRQRDKPISINLQSLTERVVSGSVRSWGTMFQEVNQLVPGAYGCITYNDRKFELSRLVSITENSCRRKHRIENLENMNSKLFHLLENAIDAHIPLDVKSQVLVSGGLDSTLLMDILKANGSSSSYIFMSETHESADRSAVDWMRMHLEERAINVGSYSFDDFLISLPSMSFVEEGYSTFEACGVFEIAKHLNANTKVVISGEGSDELFGGYPEYVSTHMFDIQKKHYLRLSKIGSIDLRKEIDILGEAISSFGSDRYIELVRERNMAEALYHNHLGIMDKHFMYRSVECRVPYLDRRVVKHAYQYRSSELVDPMLGLQKLPLKMIASDVGGWAQIAAFRRKIGFPSASYGHRAVLESKIKRYRRRTCNELNAFLPMSGLSALAWDLFYIQCVERKFSGPDQDLVGSLLREQSIPSPSEK